MGILRMRIWVVEYLTDQGGMGWARKAERENVCRAPLLRRLPRRIRGWCRDTLGSLLPRSPRIGRRSGMGRSCGNRCTGWSGGMCGAGSQALVVMNGGAGRVPRPSFAQWGSLLGRESRCIYSGG